MLKFSTIAYDSRSQISAWNCPRCLSTPASNLIVVENPGLGAFGFAAYSSRLGAIVMSFRGSNNFVDWLVNLSTKKIYYGGSCSGCKVHSGFAYAYLSVRNQIRSAILQLQSRYPSAPIYATGHSLGGAMAMLFGVLYLDNYGTQVNLVYTFGQPRVGNSKFADYY